MDLKRDLLLGVGALVAILLIVCIGSIGLYVRMSPAVEHVLQENDVSLAATEEMLAAVSSVPASPEDTAKFRAALDRLRANAIEPDGQPEILTVERAHEAALSGDVLARQQVVAALLRLAQINRAAMHRANAEVQRLGWAGAWATAILCLIGFAAAIVVTRRIDRRIAHPMAELSAAISAALAGEVHRRCVHVDAQAEVRFLMESFNLLLDRHASPVDAPEPCEGVSWREAAQHLLEESSEPRLLLNDAGRVVAANKEAMDRMGDTSASVWRGALDGAVASEVVDPVTKVVTVGDGLRMCLLSRGPAQLGSEPGGKTLVGADTTLRRAGTRE